MSSFPGAMFNAEGSSLDATIPDLTEETLIDCPHRSMMPHSRSGLTRLAWEHINPYALPGKQQARHMMALLVRAAVLAGLVGLPLTAHAQFTTFTMSGDYYLPGCKSLIAEVSNSNNPLIFKSGQCLGAITVLKTWLKGVGATCMPPSVTVRQIVQVVVKYMEDHPAQLNEDFLNLAGPAIHDAWPCQTTPSQPRQQ